MLLSKLVERIFSYHVDADFLEDKRIIIQIRNFLRRNRLFRYLYRWDSKKSQRGLCVFIIRQDDKKFKILEKCLLYIKKAGFQIIGMCSFASDNIDYRLRLIKTDIEFWTTAYPITCVAVVDPKPISMYFRAKQIWPFWTIDESIIGDYYYRMMPNMDNLRILVKNSIRVAIEKSLPKPMREKYIHSADNFEEAWEYIKIIMPRESESIRSKLLQYNKHADK